ncbi:hypothetical protein LTR49_022497 [Elasticomyces elasticus]|nr:hypothetical protein LTR49_022497 [Elasticomyces elasticus]KAK5719675.1 hypothetical protein LTS12_027654 [Elasticomyces elasticus]
MGLDWRDSAPPATLEAPSCLWHGLQSKIFLRHQLFKTPNDALDLLAAVDGLRSVQGHLRQSELGEIGEKVLEWIGQDRLDIVEEEETPSGPPADPDVPSGVLPQYG